jgi:hypothetical protein
MDLTKAVLALVGFLVPPDPAVTDFVATGDPTLVARAEKAMQELRLWRWKVSILLFTTTATMAWLIIFGDYVRASDVNGRVHKALGPVQMKLDDISVKMDNLEKAINNQLAVAAVDNICKLVVRRSKESDENERQSLRRDIDALQISYRQYMRVGFDYPENRCER